MLLCIYLHLLFHTEPEKLSQYSVSTTGVRLSEGTGNELFLHRRVQTGSVTNLAFPPMVSGGNFPKAKVAAA